MSKADVQAISLLVVVAGSFVCMEKGFPHLPAPLREKICNVRERVFTSIELYPSDKGDARPINEIVDKVTKWEEVLEKHNLGWSMIFLLAASSQCLADLLGKLKNKYKISLIEPLMEDVNGLIGILDHGKNYEYYDKVADVLYDFYKIIGFQE